MNNPQDKEFGASFTGGNTISLLQALSFYSPVITMISILIFSIFSAALDKGLFYLFSVFVVSAFRRGILLAVGSDRITPRNNICDTGLITKFTGWSYSTYVLTFTICYFITPMFILNKVNNTNMINYGVLTFFITYILFDIYIKYTLNCVYMNSALLGDFLLGGLFGGLTALLLFYSDKISLLFINELNSNKEVCSVPSKQQFKCSLYRNGSIVGSSVSE
jgi:hypothetical protein